MPRSRVNHPSLWSTGDLLLLKGDTGAHCTMRLLFLCLNETRSWFTLTSSWTLLAFLVNIKFIASDWWCNIFHSCFMEIVLRYATRISAIIFWVQLGLRVFFIRCFQWISRRWTLYACPPTLPNTQWSKCALCLENCLFILHILIGLFATQCGHFACIMAETL